MIRGAMQTILKLVHPCPVREWHPRTIVERTLRAQSAKTLTDYFSVIVSAAFTRGIALLTSVLVARELGSAEFGRFSIFYASLVLTWQFSAAFDSTFICQAKATESPEEKNELLKISVIFKIFYSSCLGLGLAGIKYLGRPLLIMDSGLSTVIGMGMASGALLTFLMSIATVSREKEHFGAFAVLSAVHTISVFCVLILFKILNVQLNLNDVINTYFIISIIIAVISVFILYMSMKSHFTINMKLLRHSFAFGKWMFGLTIVYFAFQRIDILFMGYYVSSDDLGIYSVAVQLVMVLSMTGGALNYVFLPKSVKAVRSKAEFMEYLRECFIPVTVMLLLLIFLYCFAPYCISLTYGPSYLGATVFLRTLLIGWVLAIVYLPFSFVFLATNDSRTRFILELSKLGLGLFTMLLMVPKIGVMGGAVAISLAMALNAITSAVVLKYKLANRFA
jgi:O-antigen/teichoic acid export membrane protein